MASIIQVFCVPSLQNCSWQCLYHRKQPSRCTSYTYLAPHLNLHLHLHLKYLPQPHPYTESFPSMADLVSVYVVGKGCAEGCIPLY